MSWEPRWNIPGLTIGGIWTPATSGGDYSGLPSYPAPGQNPANGVYTGVDGTIYSHLGNNVWTAGPAGYGGPQPWEPPGGDPSGQTDVFGETADPPVTPDPIPVDYSQPSDQVTLTDVFGDPFATDSDYAPVTGLPVFFPPEPSYLGDDNYDDDVYEATPEEIEFREIYAQQQEQRRKIDEEIKVLGMDPEQVTKGTYIVSDGKIYMRDTRTDTVYQENMIDGGWIAQEKDTPIWSEVGFSGGLDEDGNFDPNSIFQHVAGTDYRDATAGEDIWIGGPNAIPAVGSTIIGQDGQIYVVSQSTTDIFMGEDGKVYIRDLSHHIH